jgi:hypothetical protein
VGVLWFAIRILLNVLGRDAINSLGSRLYGIASQLLIVVLAIMLGHLSPYDRKKTRVVLNRHLSWN